MITSSKTLLRIPELIEAVNRLTPNPVTPADVFRLIGTGDIKPLGFAQRIPFFSVEQIADVAARFTRDGAQAKGAK
jgi:hypothetical protein